MWGFRAHPCTANQENGAPDQEGPHHSYEVCLANYDAPAFSLHVSLATSTKEHATQRSPAHLGGAYSPNLLLVYLWSGARWSAAAKLLGAGRDRSPTSCRP